MNAQMPQNWPLGKDSGVVKVNISQLLCCPEKCSAADLAELLEIRFAALGSDCSAASSGGPLFVSGDGGGRSSLMHSAHQLI